MATIKIDTKTGERVVEETPVPEPQALATKKDFELSADLQERFTVATKRLKFYEQIEKQLRAEIMRKYEESGSKETWHSEDGTLTISYKNGYERTDIDKEKLFAEYPDAYIDCKKTIKVRPSVAIKVVEIEKNR